MPEAGSGGIRIGGWLLRLWWWGIARRNGLVVPRVGRTGGGGRWGGVIAFNHVLVHGDKDGRRFKQLDLLVLGDEQLGGDCPFGRMFPPVPMLTQTLRTNCPGHHTMRAYARRGCVRGLLTSASSDSCYACTLSRTFRIAVQSR